MRAILGSSRLQANYANTIHRFKFCYIFIIKVPIITIIQSNLRPAPRFVFEAYNIILLQKKVPENMREETFLYIINSDTIMYIKGTSSLVESLDSMSYG